MAEAEVAGNPRARDRLRAVPRREGSEPSPVHSAARAFRSPGQPGRRSTTSARPRSGPATPPRRRGMTWPGTSSPGASAPRGRTGRGPLGRPAAPFPPPRSICWDTLAGSSTGAATSPVPSPPPAKRSATTPIPRYRDRMRALVARPPPVAPPRPGGGREDLFEDAYLRSNLRADPFVRLVRAAEPEAGTDFELTPSTDLVRAVEPAEGSDFELFTLDASDEFEAAPPDRERSSDRPPGRRRVDLGRLEAAVGPRGGGGERTSSRTPTSTSKSPPWTTATPGPRSRATSTWRSPTRPRRSSRSTRTTSPPARTPPRPEAAEVHAEQEWARGGARRDMAAPPTRSGSAPAYAPSGLFRGVLGPFRQAVAAIAGSRPLTVTDRVHFSLTAPATLEPGRSYALDVWAYIKARRAEAMAMARESQGTDDIRVKTKDGVVIARGVVVTVRLAIPTMEIADPEDVIDWDGKIGNATFPVSVPAEARPGPHSGTATFHVEDLRIAKLHFVLEVGRGDSTRGPPRRPRDAVQMRLRLVRERGPRRGTGPAPGHPEGAAGPRPLPRCRLATLGRTLGGAAVSGDRPARYPLSFLVVCRQPLALGGSRVADRAGPAGDRGDRPGPPRLARRSSPADRTRPAPPLQ